MSEVRPTIWELEVIPARVSFGEEELAKLQADVRSEIEIINEAKAIKEAAYKLRDRWGRSGIIDEDFENFFSSEEGHLKYDDKILDISPYDRTQLLDLRVDHPRISGKELGYFDLDAVNLYTGKVIISASVMREVPPKSEWESEIASTFAFIADPSLGDQEVEIHLSFTDDTRQEVLDALMPSLAEVSEA